MHVGNKNKMSSNTFEPIQLLKFVNKKHIIFLKEIPTTSNSTYFHCIFRFKWLGNENMV